MKRQIFSWLLVIGVAFVVTSTTQAQIVQAPDTDYLVVEAEAFTLDELNDEFTGFLIIDAANPSEVELHGSNPGTIMVPPPESNASGTAIFDQAGGGDFKDSVGWELNFATPGVYYLYSRHSFFDLRDLVNLAYSNEDSIYTPVEDLSDSPGYNGPLGDPAGDDLIASRDGAFFMSKEIDGVEYGPIDGCRIPEEPWVLDAAECEAEGLRGEEQWEGQYHWAPVTWNNDLGHANYVVEDTGVALDFSISSRERGTAIDMLIFSQNPDLTPEELDALMSPGLTQLEQLATITDPAERLAFVHDVLGTWMGDSNLDGEFNSGDLVTVFGVGEYEDATDGNSGWEDGDWNGDMDFNSSDLVTAFSDGGYEQGPRAAVAAAVPEPSTIVLCFLAALALLPARRR